MRKFVFVLLFPLLGFYSAQTQCTYQIPPGTQIITHDTVINHCLTVFTSYLICGDVRVTDSSTCTAFPTYYVDSLAELVITPNPVGQLAFITTYVKSGGSFDANNSNRTDTLYYTNGATITDTLGVVVAINPGCLIYDYSLIGGNPCGTPSGTASPAAISFSLHPNPATDFINVNFAVPVSGNAILSDTQGRRYSGQKFSSDFRLNTESLPGGIYLLTLETDKGIYTRQVSVIR